ncbi:MAG: hypothetical protein M3142_05890 [Bacteroidota bacterium]|nr:hypothetical protein [Bacteroidota bacterium]
MKKLILSLSLILPFGLVKADDNAGVKVRSENVKMYQQAGSSTPVLLNLATTDRIELLRKWNNQWAQVKVNHKIGYVLFSDLILLKPESQSTTAGISTTIE